MLVFKLERNRAVAVASSSQAHFRLSSSFSRRRRAARFWRIVTLYVSRKKRKNRVSHIIATAALIHRMVLQPNFSARMPLAAGPMAPPISGKSEMMDIPFPRLSDGKMSPTMAGLRTFDTTAIPVRKRAKMKRFAVWLTAASRMPKMKTMLPMLKMGYRPKSSDSGANRRGPIASPSSQTVTRRMAEERSSRPSRSRMIWLAMGTREMHVNVLFFFGFCHVSQLLAD